MTELFDPCSFRPLTGQCDGEHCLINEGDEGEDEEEN